MHFSVNINQRPLRHYSCTSTWLRLLRDILVDSWARLGWAGLGWAGLGWAGLWNLYGTGIFSHKFLNKPIQRERDFGGQQYFYRKFHIPFEGQLVCP